jgi:6-phosphogluconolactonase
MLSRVESWDDRRSYIVAGDGGETIQFAAEHWIHSAKRSIQQRGRFAVALSGGSTPKEIYRLLSKETDLEWDKVFLFWSDERGSLPDDPGSNFHMSMSAGLKNLPIPESQIFRMKAEVEPEKNARDYEETIHRVLGKSLFDLVMLGVGEDGHTASLFPKSPLLQICDRLVAAEYNAEKKGWRITLTIPCINQSQGSAIYALGPSKALIVSAVLDAALESIYPASSIGTSQHKALWVLDEAAAAKLNKSKNLY